MKKIVLFCLLFATYNQNAMNNNVDPNREDACWLAQGVSPDGWTDQHLIASISKALSIIRREHPELVHIKAQPKDSLVIIGDAIKDLLFIKKLEKTYNGMLTKDLFNKQETIVDFDCTVDTQALMNVAKKKGIQVESYNPCIASSDDFISDIMIETHTTLWNFTFIKMGYDSSHLVKTTAKTSVFYDYKDEKIISRAKILSGKLVNFSHNHGWIQEIDTQHKQERS